MNLHQILCKLDHSSAEIIQMIQKAITMGNWWLAASSQQCACSCIISLQSFLVKHQITQVAHPLLQPRFGTLGLLAFPKTKITFERDGISDYWWDSRKYEGAANGDWENCVRLQGAYFEGDWGIIVLCTMFLLSYMVFINYWSLLLSKDLLLKYGLYFSYYMSGYLLDRPCIPFLFN